MFSIRHTIRRSALTLLAAAAPQAFAGGTIVSDTEFVNTDWSLTTFVMGNGGTITSNQFTTGNPAPGRSVLNSVAGGGSSVVGFHEFTGGPMIDPGSESIDRLDFTIARRPFSGLGNFQNFGLAIKQNGVAYRSTLGIASGGTFEWATVTRTLRAGDFVRFDGQPGIPDFSPAGSPMSVGFWSGSNTQPGDGGLNQRVIYDNFEVAAILREPILRHAWSFEGSAEDHAGNGDGAASVDTQFRGQDTGHDVPFELGRALYVGATPAAAGQTIVVPSSEVDQFGSDNFTIAFWWKNDFADGDQDWIFDAGNAAGWRMQFLNNRLRFTDVAAGGAGAFESPNLTNADSWNHVAFVCDRNGAGTITWYLNGAPLNSVSAAAMSNLVSDQDLRIGSATESNDGLDGYLDSVRFYNVALTEGQVRDLAGANAPVCVGDLNGDDLVTFADLSIMLDAFNLPCY